MMCFEKGKHEIALPDTLRVPEICVTIMGYGGRQPWNYFEDYQSDR